MPITILIPTPLQKLTDDASAVRVEAATVRAALAALEVIAPGVNERLLQPDGSVRRFVNVYVNGEDIRFLQQLDTALPDGAELSIIPAIAGG